MQSGSAFGSGAVRCVTPHPPPPLSPPPCLCAGRREAAQLAAELAPHMAAQDATLRALGLHSVWASLHKLALATPVAAAAVAAADPHPSAQQAPEAELTAAMAEPPLPVEVWALQQRVQQYKAKHRALKVGVRVRELVDELQAVAAALWLRCIDSRCPHLLSSACLPCCAAPQATVVALEGAAARWQSQAGEVEQGLALLRFRWGHPTEAVCILGCVICWMLSTCHFPLVSKYMPCVCIRCLQAVRPAVRSQVGAGGLHCRGWRRRLRRHVGTCCWRQPRVSGPPG